MRRRSVVILAVNGLILAFIGLVCLAPMISVAIAGGIANQYGCTLHEGFPNPCVINGVDYGETLYSMGVMGWLFFLSVPIAVGMLIVYALVWVMIGVVKFVQKRRSRMTPALS